MWTNSTSINVLYDNAIYLDPIVTSVTWSGDITQAYRKLELSLSNTLDGVWQAVDIKHGKEIRFLNEDKELFRGVIFTHVIDSNGMMTVTAYDENVYLTKNADTKKLVNMTASAIVKSLCTEFGVPVGDIADTGYVIPKLILRNMTLWDMMITALTETRKQTGRRFFIYSQEGRLNLVERGEKIIEWVLENGTNITGASYSQSIEDLRNQVKIFGGDEQKSPISASAKNDDLITKFGLMQHVETADSDKTQSQIAELAQKRLAELGKVNDVATVEALGLDDVIASRAVYVRESLTGIVGGFYVITDSHTYANGTHTMSITVSGDESLPKLEYDAPAEPEEKKRKSRKKGKQQQALDQMVADATARSGE